MSKTRYPGVKRLTDGRYRIRVKWTDPKTGRQKDAEKVIAAPSIADAAAQRAGLRAELQRGRTSPLARVRLGEYATKWMSGKLPTLAPSTRRGHACVLDLHVIPALGDYYVDALTRDDVIGWRNAQKGEPATVNSRLRMLKTMLRDAVVELELPRDPTLGVKAVREVRSEDDPNCLTAEQLGRVLAHLREHEPQCFPVLATLAYTGARFGEVTALKWEDIDEAKGEIRIRRAQWKGQVGPTKTGSTRTVPLAGGLKEILRDHRARSLAAQGAGLAEGWVFVSTNGGLLHNSTPWDALKRATTACKIPHRFTQQGFRRTLNNLLRQATTGEVVRSVTGHVTEAMTEHYSHVGLGEKQAAFARVFALVQPSQVGVEVGVATDSPVTPGAATAEKRGNR
jgi:integrase